MSPSPRQHICMQQESGTQSVSLAFKVHFLLLYKKKPRAMNVSSSQRGHKFFSCFIEPQLHEKPWRPRAVFGFKESFSLSSGAALTPRDSCCVALAVGQWADGGVFSFHTDPVLAEAATGCPTLCPTLFPRSFQKETLCLQGKRHEAIFCQKVWSLSVFGPRESYSLSVPPVHVLTAITCPLCSDGQRRSRSSS